jgi:type IV pilus assembly protein PilW
MSDLSRYALASATRGALNVTPLAAAVIVSNGANPDSISLYSGSSATGTGTLRITDTYAGGGTLSVDRVPYGFALNDVLLLAPETAGGQCALTQITADPAALPKPPSPQWVPVAPNVSARFAPAVLGPTFLGGISRAFNLGPAGNLSFHTWSVANGFLQLRATDLSGASAAPSTVVDNVVSIKAQYGFDLTGTFNPDNGMVVSQWSPTMISTDGVAPAGKASDYQRITALRIAVVARSKAPERPAAGAACSATLDPVIVFGTKNPSSVTAVPMTVNVAVTGDPVDWHCYRYRVFETIVPIRNAAWRPSADRVQ